MSFCPKKIRKFPQLEHKLLKPRPLLHLHLQPRHPLPRLPHPLRFALINQRNLNPPPLCEIPLIACWIGRSNLSPENPAWKCGPPVGLPRENIPSFVWRNRFNAMPPAGSKSSTSRKWWEIRSSSNYPKARLNKRRRRWPPKSVPGPDPVPLPRKPGSSSWTENWRPCPRACKT